MTVRYNHFDICHLIQLFSCGTIKAEIGTSQVSSELMVEVLNRIVSNKPFNPICFFKTKRESMLVSNEIGGFVANENDIFIDVCISGYPLLHTIIGVFGNKYSLLTQSEYFATNIYYNFRKMSFEVINKEDTQYYHLHASNLFWLHKLKAYLELLKDDIVESEHIEITKAANELYFNLLSTTLPVMTLSDTTLESAKKELSNML